MSKGQYIKTSAWGKNNKNSRKIESLIFKIYWMHQRTEYTWMKRKPMNQKTENKTVFRTKCKKRYRK